MMKRLGDYIRPVDVRNRDLKVTRLVGLTIDKAFIPSVANTIGTDLSNYKVISEKQFACSLMQVSRDGKMPIAMFKGEPCIMSPAYPMFEVSKKNELLPEYLMMWFSRSEFDREASFYAVGGVRGSLEWNDFCDMQIPVPAIEKQRETVAEYNTLATRIETNKKLIATLEQTAQTLYRHTFIDNIDPNNLPEGWRMGTVGDLGRMVSGATPSTTVPDYWCENGIPWISPADLSRTGLKFISRGAKDITKSGYDSASTWLLPKGSVLFSSRAPIGLMGIVVSELCTNQGFKSIVPNEKYGFGYVYYCLNSLKDKIASENTGSTFDEVSGERLKLYEVVLPEEKVTVEFQNVIEKIFNLQEKKENENIILDKMISVVLSKICC
ncbi:restriction endonuclease subunit S [uncultured Fibrobacter sp.]|uniref:restriction endonuclease subunit S n=1 Tax=uncultured Fibrobacter sp. TaxID=261512 RepID=UPI0025FFC291|nr:restriction endonuclease subunit S [uncultured Fibrobacter sp.]